MKYIMLFASILVIFLVTSCSKDDNQNIETNSIEIQERELLLGLKETKQLNVIFEPANASNQDIVWTSSDESIAVVNSTGAVTGKYIVGYAIITATSKNGKTAERRVDVVIKFP